MNSLALSTEYALRTGPFGHKGAQGLPADDAGRQVGGCWGSLGA